MGGRGERGFPLLILVVVVVVLAVKSVYGNETQISGRWN